MIQIPKYTFYVKEEYCPLTGQSIVFNSNLLICILQEKKSLENELKLFHAKYNELYDEIFTSLRDDNGQRYSREDFSLQHTLDGNIFLVPNTNSTTSSGVEEERQKGARRKRTQKR